MTTVPTSHSITTCQICGNERLESILFLGFIPPVNTMLALGSTFEEQPAYPLELLRCPGCTLVQIGLEVDPSVLFPPSYPYRSGTTRILRENFADLYAETKKIVGIEAQDLIVDIGSNDGTLLTNFRDAGHKVLGVEPSRAGDDARARGIDTLTAFFSHTTAIDVKKQYGPARVITAANVFAHIGDIHSVVDGIMELLTSDGVFISESHYLLGLVQTLQYDTVYHEHLRYYSLVSLKSLFEAHGLEIFHVTRIPTHGGSIRVYASHQGQRAIDSSVSSTIAEEEKSGLTDGSLLKQFRERVIRSKTELYVLLSEVKRKGGRIYGIGAPSRASTLINYIGLDDGILECVMEVGTSPKVNKYIPGTRIPVLDEAKLFIDQPEYALLLSWHIQEELITNLQRKGFKGQFIVPLPEPHLVAG